jgi:ACS family hexuronate transporter-like MFS transporter
MLTDPVWYFLQFWMPKYLHSERGLSQNPAHEPVADLPRRGRRFHSAEGFMSDALVRRGRLPANARRWVMGAAALVVPLFIAWVPHLAAIEFVFAFSMVVALAHAAWLTCNAALVMDLVSKPLFATAFGFVSAGSAFRRHHHEQRRQLGRVATPPTPIAFSSWCCCTRSGCS